MGLSLANLGTVTPSPGRRSTGRRQRVRQLADEKRSLEDKLQAARSNNRFLDKRIAQLEAELASPRGPQEAT